MSERDVDRVIQELVDARVLDPIDENTWRFRHELLREVAAELSPPSLRRRLHGRVADALLAAAAEGNPDWKVIANHYEQAERYAKRHRRTGRHQTMLDYAAHSTKLAPT